MLLRVAADENFNHDILHGLRKRVPNLDVAIVQNLMPSAPDDRVLEWAAGAGRVVLTHDEQTMVGHAYARIKARLEMAGVVLVHSTAPVGRAIDELELIVSCENPEDFVDRVQFVPL